MRGKKVWLKADKLRLRLQSEVAGFKVGPFVTLVWLVEGQVGARLTQSNIKPIQCTHWLDLQPRTTAKHSSTQIRLKWTLSILKFLVHSQRLKNIHSDT